MHKRFFAVFAGTTLVISGLVTGAAAAPPELVDNMTGWAVLAPGQSGQGFTPHEEDQRSEYAALADDSDITEEELGTYFHPLQWGPEAIEEEYQPPGRTDVTIYRDANGVPNIYGDTDEALAYGVGYATAEDRMWQIDLIRHLAKGQIAEFLAEEDNEAAYLGSDKGKRRSGYTEAELQEMFDALDDRFGADGALTQTMLLAYTDGVNAYVTEANGPGNRPGEYSVTGNELLPWEVLDTLAVAVDQGRNLGAEGGDEVIRAAFLKKLRSRLGKETGTAVFNDFLFRNDPDAYTTIEEADGAFESPTFSTEVNPKAVALPDNVKSLARKIQRRARGAESVERKLGLPKLASNTIAVAGSDTKGGDPIHYGAPQLGYNAPSSLWEAEGHSPSFDWAGVLIPGAPFMAIGRTNSHAWMVPVGVGDMLDERVEKLCNPKGKKVAKRSKFYMFDGECIKMEIRTELIHGIDPEEAPLKYKVFRTVHGPVTARATVKGKPVAISEERATWGREPDVLTALMYWQKKTTATLDDFQTGVSDYFPFSFNMSYANKDVAAYWYTGLHAVRADGVDPMLPSWGTGQWEWQRFITEEERPHVVEPSQGWLVNWNNKPSVGWDGGPHGNWGPLNRVHLLAAGMAAHNGKFDMSDVIEVAATAATQDGNAFGLWEHIGPSISPSSPAGIAALAALELWVEEGAHRTDLDRDSDQDSPIAVATWDEMLETLIDNVFSDELGDLGTLGIQKTADPRVNNGSAYFISYADYLWNLVSGHADKYSRDYCDNIDSAATETCAQQIQAAFDTAITDLSAAQGDNPATWEWEADYIEFSSLGTPSVAPMPWQNRGTWNHIVQIHEPN